MDKIRAIESDVSLSDREKAKRRQELLSGASDGEKAKAVAKDVNAGGALAIFGDKFNCSICMQLLDRPVSTPCGHNFCLKCFQKWIGQQRKKTCAICRKPIPAKMAREPRINSAIVMAIRMAKSSQPNYTGGPPKTSHFIHNQDRPDKAFTTERAKKTGKANACSGRIFVTIPSDFFGPITAEYDPIRNLGVTVGETWEDRMECRQWGAHFPHVGGIAGQSNHGSQSIALSGGYEDDEDHGEWFLYTGSGGRDLTGNRRTNKKQSSDQKFKSYNEALRVSCCEGYPVRVVRSAKEKRSSYAPQEGVRYDGVYRVEKCWLKPGQQRFLVCRYLLIRCDNDPAPWTTDDHGDRPRPLPCIPELKQATNITERKQSPAWDYDEQLGRWTWVRPQPPSKKAPGEYDDEGRKIKKKTKCGGRKGTVKEKLLKEFSCLICRKVMVMPLTTPCAHNFCKACLEGAFAGQSLIKERRTGGRTLRAQKNVMKCPSCKHDIADFLQNPQVNRELMNVIETLQTQMEEESLKAKEAEDGVDGQSLNSCDDEMEEDEDMEMEMEEDEDSMDEESNIDAESEENFDVDAENKGNCDVNAEIVKANKNDEPSNGIEAQRVSKRKKPCSDAAAKASDSTLTDNQCDIVAENKENCDVNAEVLKVDKNDKPSNTKPQRVSKRKKPCNAAGDGGSEDHGTVKVGRPKRTCVRKNAGAN